MSYNFIRLTGGYNEELLALLATSENGSDGFSISRAPDFFALPHESGDSEYYGVVKDGRLLACAGVSIQKRFIKGHVEDVYYLRDLRIDPLLKSPVIFGRLIKGLLSTRNEMPRHVVSVILGSNPFMRTITDGNTLFQKAEKIGEIIHTGFPLFCGATDHSSVERITPDEAWSFYCSTIQHLDFASADENCFKLHNGFFLGLKINGKLHASCKIVDQESSRRILSQRKPVFAERLLNIYCSITNAKKIPEKGEVFAHCYLSFYTSLTLPDHREKFVGYLRKYHATDYCYVFTGLLPSEAKKYKSIFMIRFNSFVYAYRNESGSRFSFPELTLI